MSIFEPVTLEYNGEKKTIPANRVMYLASIIELNFKPLEINQCKILPAATAAILAKPMLEYAGFVEVDIESLAVYYRTNRKQCDELIDICYSVLHKLVPPQELTGEDNSGQATTESETEAGKKPSETEVPSATS